MAIKRAGGRSGNPVSVKKNRNLREEAFMEPPRKPSPRAYDVNSMIADGTTSVNGVVVTTANLGKR